MRFSYHYKTSDGARHSGVYAASSKPAVYEELKEKGIKPFGVEPLPGLLNRLSGIGRRWTAIIILSVALAVALTWSVVFYLRQSSSSGRLAVQDFTADKERRQLIGDSAVIELGVRSGWSDVFENEGERFLASFAIPGMAASVKSTSVAELESALGRRSVILEGDSIEARQIKSMVEGMKDEMRRYISAGGTIKTYGERLVERQEEELSYYRRLKTEVDTAISAGRPNEEVMKLWEEGNAELRKMGIRLVPLPGGIDE